MTLAAGTRLGSFEITGTLGTGGMGEVYRATDTKLGREVAISQHVWIYDLARGSAPLRLTSGEFLADGPVWTPDGRGVVYKGDQGFFRRAADGSGEAQLLARFPDLGSQPRPLQITPDGETLLMQAPWNGVDSDLYTLSLLRPEEGVMPLLAEDYSELLAAVSPNGRWLAYTSNETGREEIYVRPYPNVDDGKWKISTNGGHSPLWGPDGRELFYRNGGDVIAVGVSTDAAFEHGEPQTLFTGSYSGGGLGRPNWDLHPDGQRFLMFETRSGFEIVVVRNAVQEIERRAPSH